MKRFARIFILIAVAVSLFILLGHNDKGDIRQVQISLSSSDIYTEKEIQAAMNQVLKFFQQEYKGCTLTDLWYEERLSAPAAKSWAEQYAAEEAMVLLSNFTVDSSGGDGSLNPDSVYSDWQWILTRSQGSEWELKTWGY